MNYRYVGHDEVNVRRSVAMQLFMDNGLLSRSSISMESSAPLDLGSSRHRPARQNTIQCTYILR